MPAPIVLRREVHSPLPPEQRCRRRRAAESAERSGLRLEGRAFSARLEGVAGPVPALRLEPARAAAWPAAV